MYRNIALAAAAFATIEAVTVDESAEVELNEDAMVEMVDEEAMELVDDEAEELEEDDEALAQVDDEAEDLEDEALAQVDDEAEDLEEDDEAEDLEDDDEALAQVDDEEEDVEDDDLDNEVKTDDEEEEKQVAMLLAEYSKKDVDKVLNADKWIDDKLSDFKESVIKTKDVNECWREAKWRDTKPLHACPRGYDKQKGLCYKQCEQRDHGQYWRGIGPSCLQDCPSGFRDIGIHCAKPAPRTRGTRVNYCNSWWGRFPCGWSYHDCPGGWSGKAFLCTKNCEWGQRSVGAGLLCLKKARWRSTQALECGEREDQAGIFCHPKCPAGWDGVSSLCFNGCPNGMFKCGLGCLHNSMSCAASVGLKFASVASTFASGGTGALGKQAILKAAQKAKRKLVKKFKRKLRKILLDNTTGGSQKAKESRAMKKLKKWIGASELADAYADTGSFYHVTCNYITNVRGYTKDGKKK